MPKLRTFKTLKQLNSQLKERRGDKEGTVLMTRTEIGYYFNNLLGSEVPKHRPIYAFGHEIIEYQASML